MIGNFETVVSAHSPSAKVEASTVHQLQGALWEGIARKGSRYFVLTVDFSGSDWSVANARRLAPGAVRATRLRFSRAAARQASWRLPGGDSDDQDQAQQDSGGADDSAQESQPPERPRKPDSAPHKVYGQIPEVTLYPVDGGGTFMPRCDQDRCLTVIVAPWCPHCRDATQTILDLRDYLANKGVGVRIVVSQDTEARCEAYAADFGRDALLDPSNSIQSHAVPQFWLSDSRGAIIGKMDGIAPEATPEQVAAALGLR